jgi:N-acetylmuramoyl-L-alanine amidase
MRFIKHIVVHCTATDTAKKAKYFYSENHKPLFHYVIERDGETVQLSYEAFSVKAIEQHDAESVHIAYIGGIDKDGKPLDNRTTRQKEALFYKLVELSTRYKNIKIVGAKDLGGLENSPGFDVKEWMKNYEPNFSLDKEGDEMRIAA